MDLIVLGAEALFVGLFVATSLAWLRRRDPVSRDVMLVFSALTVLFAFEVWRRATGEAIPPLLSRLGTALFILQPIFTLHLVTLVRHVPRWLLPAAAIASLGTGIPTVLLSPEIPVSLVMVAFAVLIANQLVAAVLLFGEGSRRWGPGAIRFVFAALSTALFSIALLVAVLGAGATEAGTAGPAIRDASRVVAGVLAIVAGIGYVIAFLPPRSVRAYWQAQIALAHGRDLVASTDEPVAALWDRFAAMASSVSGGSSAVIVPNDAGGARLLATSGFDPPADLEVTETALATLGTAGLHGDRLPAETGPIGEALADAAHARFVSAVPLTPPSGGPSAMLVLLGTHRSLFQASDAELLASLGAQTAMEAQRRSAVAQQEGLAQRLAATNEVLLSASKAKSDFLASMSHELRTPLSAILGFSDLMRQEPREGENVVVPVEWVELIHRGGEHLLSLINDVLDLAKVEAGRLDLQPEPVDLPMAVGELINGVRPLAERKQLQLTASVPPLTVDVDRGRLRQVLYNLLSNAIKYTPEGGAVRVDVGETDGWASIAVSDTGVGIAEQDQRAVFEEFRQVGDPAERQEGTGLGLALTRRLVEAHGGRIELASRRGEGSRFTVFLPSSHIRDTVAAGAPGAVADALAVAAPDGRDLLVIEDDPGAVRLLREYLEPAGYGMRVATDGEAGIRMAVERRPAAIILDVLLPGIDGWEVLRRLKHDPGLRDVPVVIVTVVDERQVGLALGAADYLVKPVQREALVGVLERWFGPPRDRRTMRVLAVDDEASARALIRAALEPEGLEIVEASGGREALDRAVSERFDLIVCDLLMPGIDGFEVVATLKADPRTALVPIVVCTAHDLGEADKRRLNGKILGIVEKGDVAVAGLRRWLARVAPVDASVEHGASAR